VEAAHLRVDTLSTCLGKAQFGVVVLDAKGAICEASDPARALFRAAPRSIGSRSGKLWVCPPAGAELEYWMRNGRPRRLGGAGFLKIPNADDRDIGLVLTRAPVESVSWLGAEPRWILLLFDLGRPLQASLEVLARDLGLSPREAQITSMLVAGRDLHSIARYLALSAHTVRAHLKSIFTKVGVGSQAELVLRAIAGPAVVVGSSS
jgi:DNA-binding CsgD family transcriptional regulator